MIDGLKVLIQRFSADGDAFQHDFGFFEAERVPFNRVRVVGPLQDLLFMQGADGVCPSVSRAVTSQNR